MTTTTTLIDTITTTAKQVGIPAKEAMRKASDGNHNLHASQIKASEAITVVEQNLKRMDQLRTKNQVKG